MPRENQRRLSNTGNAAQVLINEHANGTIAILKKLQDRVIQWSGIPEH